LGGGIWSDGMLIITQSTFTSNHAQNGQGGGLLSSGTVSITISTFADNSALGGGASEGGGGGGLSISGTGSLTNTTVVHNAARDIGGAGTARGGGLEVSGVVTLTNCTIAENVADAFAPPGEGRSDGGGISGSTVDLQNTILARNRSQIRTPDEPDAVSPSECDGPLTSLGTNLIGDPTGCLITLQASDLTGDPGFGDFTDNGTPGNGHFPLLPTSQAIDAGNDAACPPTDQLGQPRVGQCDIGASEFKGGALMNVNDLVTFTPLPSTFTTTLDPACPTGFAGKFSFVARLTAKASSPALTDLRVQVQTLTNGNLLQNADGGPGGVGATLTVPQADAFADGLLSPEEAVDVPFVVCLQERSPFRFLVDVLGIVSDEGE
jgi:hypothetical protein